MSRSQSGPMAYCGNLTATRLHNTRQARWKGCTRLLKEVCKSLTFPLGHLPPGTSANRRPCRYTTRNSHSSPTYCMDNLPSSNPSLSCIIPTARLGFATQFYSVPDGDSAELGSH